MRLYDFPSRIGGPSGCTGASISSTVPPSAEEARVAARRSIALQMRNAGAAPARLTVQEGHQLVDTPHAGSGVAEAAHGQAACRRIRGFGELDLVPAAGQQHSCALGPFDDRRAVLQRLIEANLARLLGGGEAIEVEVRDRQPRRLVDLAQREGRARHLGCAVAQQGGDQRARQRGLAGPHLAA